MRAHATARGRRQEQVGWTDAVTARSVGDQRSSSLGFVAP